MTAPSGNAPAWLFAFVDLAFLLLLAMTQLGGNPNAPELGELRVPRIGGEATQDLPSRATELWQVRVHPPTGVDPEPFELVGAESRAERLSAGVLRVRLAELHASKERKPLLAPHADSRSQDFLDAVQLIEDQWPSRRRATVERVLSIR